MQLASAYGKLGNIDANTGDAETGWDTDQFMTDPKEALLVAATILKQGGMAPGDNSIVYSMQLLCRTSMLASQLEHQTLIHTLYCMRQCKRMALGQCGQGQTCRHSVLRRVLQQVGSILMPSCEGRAHL